ncbi:hypothetical protein [Bradyrhizobium sp. SEMIA]|uniref:hypothetical protein n=1 Tax=Bradyrhizobium sp. SEMIA TaxID=2597515 RepID=UPI0018A64831|nr:hypothetical protein [Bradyrhizobium sp. SEMIA]QOG17526.1 hypothetical protein FOM02_09395 [Bradyrhizobium sp. SEMIA]
MSEEMSNVIEIDLERIVRDLEEVAFWVREYEERLTPQWLWNYAATRPRAAGSLVWKLDSLLAKLTELRSSAPAAFIADWAEEKMQLEEIISVLPLLPFPE